MPKKVATTVYITEEQQHLLKSLNERSKIPVAEFIRQGIDLAIAKYQDWLPGQLEFGPLPQGEPKRRQQEIVGSTAKETTKT